MLTLYLDGLGRQPHLGGGIIVVLYLFMFLDLQQYSINGSLNHEAPLKFEARLVYLETSSA